MASNKLRIAPNPPRWVPSPDPASIVVPGLKTDASVTDQIEQIEQLITIKLQNIDENFSRIHNELANKVLPAIKRYAVGTEPVREAAKFWTSFYEQAAQIRIPTYDDYSTVNENTSEAEDTQTSLQERADTTVQIHSRQLHEGQYEASTVNSENSFMPGQGLVSSTPAMSRAGTFNRENYIDDTLEQPSWTPSTESPLVRLNREIANLSTDTTDDSILRPQSVSRSTVQDDTSIDSAFGHDGSMVPSSGKGKGKEPSQPLLHKVLRHNIYSTSDNSTFNNKPVSPLKFRAKPKTPLVDKTRNPYLPEQATPSDWSGVVDLRDPSVLTPQRKPKLPKMTTATPYDDDDESFDGLPPGMSPPVLMSPARPPRSSAELGLLKLGQTPARDATTRIQRDLLRDAQHQSGAKSSVYKGTSFYETSTSTVMTPPSLSRYKRANEYSTDSNITKDSSLESMIRNIRKDIHPDESRLSGTFHLRPEVQGAKIPTAITRQNPEPSYSPGPSEPATPLYNPIHQQHHQDDLDSDSDSLDLDEINNTAHPSAAFLMASQGLQYSDGNSFGSSNNSSDSLADEDIDAAAGIVPVHPFAQSGPVLEDDGFDDDSESFDGFETQPAGVLGSSEYQEETVFGLAPAHRMAPTGQLRMLGDDLLQDTIGIGSHIAASRRPVDESPTPNLWVPR